MSPPTNCPVCGKDLSTFTPQKAYGHIGGHKRRKSHQTEPNAQPNAQKAVFEVSEETPKKLEKIDVTKTKPPAEAKVAEAATEGLQDIVKLFAELYNEYATGKPVDYSITTEDGARVSRAVVLLDSKYHFGVEAATGYFPEIFAAIVIGAICFKIYIGIVSKKGRGRTRTA